MIIDISGQNLAIDGPDRRDRDAIDRDCQAAGHAPDQEIRIASINPGIEVNDGVLTYEMRPDMVLAVKGGAWPFLDGTLTLLPVTMRMGVAEVRRYTLMIEGLNAARFVERMNVQGVALIGTLTPQPPGTDAGELQTEFAAAQTLREEKEKWMKTIEQKMFDLAFKVRGWQLGNDSDIGFI